VRFNRASRDQVPIRERQAKVLVERGFDAGVLDTDKVVLVEGDLTQQNFGLSEETYKQVCCQTLETGIGRRSSMLVDA